MDVWLMLLKNNTTVVNFFHVFIWQCYNYIMETCELILNDSNKDWYLKAFLKDCIQCFLLFNKLLNDFWMIYKWYIF